MKPFLTFVFLILTLSVTLGQAIGLQQMDSLKHQLSISKHDTSRVLILAELSNASRSAKPDSAMLYGQQALTLARQIHFPRGEVNALQSISVVQRELGNLPNSLDVALKALKIAQDHHYEREEGLCLVRVANVYFATEDFPKALSYYQQAEKKLKNVSWDWGLAIAQMFIGDTYEQMDRLDSALYYEQLVLGKMFKIENKGLHQQVLRVLGNIQAKKGNDSLALAYYQRGIQAALKNTDYRTASAIYIKVASFYKKLTQPDSAIYYAKQGLTYGQMLSYKNRIMAASSLLAELYEQKDANEALRYYKIAIATKDSMFSAEKVQALQAKTFNEQERQWEIQVANMAYQNKIKQYALLAALGVFLLIALILYRNNILKQKANKLLKRQKEEIDTQKSKLEHTLLHLESTQAQLIQKEKMASLGELTAGIAHEIQNPLNFVNNFSEVNKELIEELEEEIDKGNMEEVKLIVNDIKENEQKVILHGKRADAIVKGMLQHSQSHTGEKEPTDINAIVEEYLRLSYHGLRTKGKDFAPNLLTDFDESIGKIEVVPQELGRVLLNLFNNAFYATAQKKTQLNGQYKPEVRISTKIVADKVEISVKDNGTGIPENVKQKIFQPFFTTKPTGEGTGLGLSLSYDIITRGHGGELRVDSKEGEFTEFTITLPSLKVADPLY